MFFLIQFLNNLGGQPQLFGGTSIHDRSMHNPHHRTLSLAAFVTALLLHSNNTSWTMPACLKLACMSTFTIEVHKLPRFEFLILPGMSSGGTQNPSSAVCFQKGSTGSFLSLNPFFKRFSLTEGLSRQVVPVLEERLNPTTFLTKGPLIGGVSRNIVKFVLRCQAPAQKFLSFHFRTYLGSKPESCFPSGPPGDESVSLLATQLPQQ